MVVNGRLKFALVQWSLLEHLARTTIKDSHKVTITRTVSVWSDCAFHKEVLQYLRDYRNSAVHPT